MSKPDKLIAPIVNSNGSNKDALALLQQDASLALYDAMGEMAKASPHGRDYQNSPDGDYAKAGEQHKARVEAVAKIIAEYAVLYHEIDEQ